MSIPPISGIPAVTAQAPVQAAEKTGSGFADAIKGALESASAAEREVDVLAREVAAGGEASVHELMVATTKASLTVDMLVQVRNRALEAYQEIMRMQI